MLKKFEKKKIEIFIKLSFFEIFLFLRIFNKSIKII
jgi:hypothetical protein